MAEKMLHERLRGWADEADGTGCFPSELAMEATGIEASIDGEAVLFRKMANEIEARYFPIPLDADGDPLEIGRTYYGENFMAWKVLSFVPGSPYPVIAVNEATGNKRHMKSGWLFRGSPAISGDGVRLKPGMEVWVSMDHAADCGKLVYEEMEGKAALIGYEYGQAAKVRSIEDAGHVDLATDSLPWCPASWLVTTQPDTQERIDADAQRMSFHYWGCDSKTCRECPAKINGKRPRERYSTERCAEAQMLDLLRRQRALDAATMRAACD